MVRHLLRRDSTILLNHRLIFVSLDTAGLIRILLHLSLILWYLAPIGRTPQILGSTLVLLGSILHHLRFHQHIHTRIRQTRVEIRPAWTCQLFVDSIHLPLRELKLHQIAELVRILHTFALHLGSRRQGNRQRQAHLPLHPRILWHDAQSIQIGQLYHPFVLIPGERAALTVQARLGLFKFRM